MEWKAFAAASNVDPNLKTTCFAAVVESFQEPACLLVSQPLQDAQGRFSPGWLLLALPSYSHHHEGLYHFSTMEGAIHNP